MSRRVPFLRGNTRGRDHIYQLMTNVETGYIGRVSDSLLPDLIAPRHTDNHDVFPQELTLDQILKWAWRIKSWKLNGTCEFSCDSIKSGFNEDGSAFTGAQETADVSVTFENFPIQTRKSLVSGEENVATEETDILGSPGAFAGPNSGVDASLVGTPYPGNYIQNYDGLMGPHDFIASTPRYIYGPDGSAVTTFTNSDETITIEWSGLALPPNSIDFGFGVTDPHTPPPTSASVAVGIELLHFDPSGAGDLSPDITDPHEDDQVIWRPGSGMFLPAIYIRFDISFRQPIVFWTSNASQNATYGPDRPNQIAWPFLIPQVSFGTIVAWSDLDGDWGAANSLYAQGMGNDYPVNPPTAVGNIVIDSTGDAFTFPMNLFGRFVFSPIIPNDPPYGVTADMTLDPDEYWPYQTLDGHDVYDTETGALKQIDGVDIDPFS